MLKLIIGRTGTGKTKYITDEFLKNKNKNKIFIVPEQFTLETERRLLSQTDTGLLKADFVMSFSSLPRKYFSVCGGNAGTYIDDFGRMILMNKAISKVSDSLQIYQNQVGKKSFTKDMLTLSSQMKTGMVTADMLLFAGEKISSSILKAKLYDAGNIISQYDALLKEKYLDSTDDLTLLADGLRENRIFEGFDIYLDGFHSFSVQESAVIESLLKQASSVTVTLPCESVADDDGFSLFSNVAEAARKLLSSARKNNVEVDKTVKLETTHRFEKISLKKAEEMLFSENIIPQEDSDGYTLTVASTLTEEAEAVARKIHRDIRQSGDKYSDCAVITRNLSQYGGIIESAFSKYKVPFFMDKREFAVTKPLFKLIISALRLASGSFQRENLFTCLKTGYFNATQDEIFLLENYIDLWGINGSNLYEEYTLHPDGYTKEMSKEAEAELRLLNEVRSRVMPPIRDFCNSLSGTFTGEFLCKEIYRLMLSLETDKKQYYDEDAAVYKLMTDILDQIYMSVGGEEINIKAAAELCISAMESAQLGKIPPTLDGVIIGTADRIRIPQVKRVYIMGLVDGEFPNPPADDGIFCEEDKEKLKKCDVIIGSDVTYWAIEEMFIAYKAFCAASQEVHLFTRRLDRSGSAARPSQLIGSVKRLFPNIKVTDLTEKIDLDERAETADSGISALAYTMENTALEAWYLQNPKYKEKTERINFKRQGNMHALKGETATALFGKDMHVSATRIEDYNKCRFAYFCKHGLRVRKQNSLSLRANEVGSFVHFVLENVLRETKDIGIYNLSNEERSSLGEKWLRIYFEEYMGGETAKTARFTFMFNRLKGLIDLLLQNISEEMKQSKFTPDGFELNIGRNGDLQPTVIECDEGTIVFEGSADRVDIMKTEEGTYLRVIDYKTGAKKFNLSDVIYGLNMQMLIYLTSLWKSGKEKYGEIIPAGILYFPATRPKIDISPNESEQSKKEKLAKMLRMNGLVLDDIKSLEGMEKDLAGVYIPVSRGKNGLRGKDSLASAERLGILSKHIDKTLKTMHRELSSGNIDAIPIDGMKGACKYCEYRSICGFEEGIDAEIKAENRKNDEVWDILNKELTEN